MRTRYYVTSIEFNKVAHAENRTVPFGFDNVDDAKKKFYSVLASNIGNTSLGWCNVIMWDEMGNQIMREYWHERTAEPEEIEA